MSDKPETPKIDSLPNGRMVDKYKIVKLLGQGGMGAVYLALNCSSGKEDDFVAIKVLFPHLAVKSGDFTRRFLREARIASKISHPNLVAVVECNFCDDGEFYYIVQEYVGGGTLRQLVSNDTVLSEEDTLTVAIGVARALEAAHKFNVVHRDIKPDNIMFGNDGTVKLTDWGIAKKVAVEDAVSVTTLELTAAKVFMGTPLYASPEQIQDTKNVDIRGDIYSLGATMYYSLVGKPPFRGTTEVESLCVILTKPPPDVRKARPDVSEKTGALIKRMLAKTPEERYQTPAELLEVLIDAAKSCSLALHPEGKEGSNGDACAGRMQHQPANKNSATKKDVQHFPEDFHTAPLAAPPQKAPSDEADAVAHTIATRYESPSKGPATNLSGDLASPSALSSDTSNSKPAAIAPPATSPPEPPGKRFPTGKVSVVVISLAVFLGGIWFALRSLQTMKLQLEDNMQRRLDEAREMGSARRQELAAKESDLASQPATAVNADQDLEATRQVASDKLAAEQAAEKARQEEAAKLAAEQARQEAAAKLAAEKAAEKARQEEAAKLAAEQARQEAAAKLAAEQARQEAAAKLAAEQAAEKARQEEAAKLAAEKARQEDAAKLAAEQAAEKARQEAAAKLAAEQAAEKARQEAAAKLAAEQAAEKARQEAAAKLAAEQAAEKARQEEAAKLAAEQAAEKARQEAAAKLAAEQAAEKTRQEAAAKLAAEKALPEKAVSDSQLLVNIKKFLVKDESSTISPGSELEVTCLRFRDALELFDQSRVKLVKDAYFRSSSSAMEFIATIRLLWETAKEPKNDEVRQLLCDTAWQQMEACLQQAAENLQNSVLVFRLSVSQQAQAKLSFLRVLAYCDEVSDDKVSTWPEDFPCRQAVSAFFPDVLLLEAIGKEEAGQWGLSPARIRWLQPFLQDDTTQK